VNPAPVRQRLRAILAGGDCVHPASVHDALSARIAEDLGFELGMLGGSTAALAVLGSPDLVLLTLSEFAEQATRITRASAMPVLADADHGYGNALNVRRAVEELERAGLAGITLEDTELPASYGASGEARLLSCAEGEGKLRAAVDARGDAGFVLLGRTSAPAISGMDEALRRIEVYVRTGVDGIFLVGVRSLEDLARVRAICPLPIVLASAPAGADRHAMAALGVRICLQGHHPIRAAVQAMHDTLRALREGVAPAQLTGLASAGLMARASREDDHARWARDYLGRSA
jgi:carboxyvinyl-carboxyphosphonate phosphorylmutase